MSTQERRPRRAFDHRLRRLRESGLAQSVGREAEREDGALINCGWGRVLFAQTFNSAQEIAESMRDERPDQRDIAFYVRDPHVILAEAPQELFLDPSHSYRLDLATYRAARGKLRGFFIRRLSARFDADAVNTIYGARGMVTVRPDFFWSCRDERQVTVLVAEDTESGEIMGSVMGLDHSRIFGDPDHGASLWCLAVGPQARQPGIGEALVRRLAEHYKARGAAHLDLSVMHDNAEAIALYEKLGFRRMPFFAVKRRNQINERLFTGPALTEGLNPYSEIIVDEARRRGIHVEVTDAEGGFVRLEFGGRSIHCRESLSELTTGVAMSICDDKAVTRRVVEGAGVRVPDQIESGDRLGLEDFLDKHGSVVVKPARGQQGCGVAVGSVPSCFPARRSRAPALLASGFNILGRLAVLSLRGLRFRRGRETARHLGVEPFLQGLVGVERAPVQQEETRPPADAGVPCLRARPAAVLRAHRRTAVRPRPPRDHGRGGARRLRAPG